MQGVRSKKGFTLIEILVVIAILAIISGIAIPRYYHFIEKSKEASDEASATVIGRAVKVYIDANELTEVPVFSYLPSDLIDTNYKFQSLKYGGPSRNAQPVLGGTTDVVEVSGNGNKAYPK